MANLNENSTDYVHSYEPNTNDLTMAMDYNNDGEPVIRVSLGGEDVTITGDVTIPGSIEISNDEGNPIPTHTHLFDENENEYTDSNPFTIDGTVTVLQGTDPWTVDGTVELGATSLSALENINATVTGTVTVDSITGAVTIQDGGGSITVDGTVNATVTGTVSVDNFPATQTVDGTVNIGTLPEIEIKNDTGNPIPISANTTANGTANPLTIQIVESGALVSDTNGLPIRILNDPNFLGIARGKALTQAEVDASYVVDKSGSTDSLGISPVTMTTVWDGGNQYPWDTWSAGAATLYINTPTDDPKLQGATIFIEGLDSNYDVQTETVTLDGTDTTTFVNTVNTYVTLNQATLTHNTQEYLPHDYDINIRYASTGGTIVGILEAPYAKTQMCLYTIPAGYEGFILASNGSSGTQDEITSMLWTQTFGEAWHQVKTFKFVSGSFDHMFRAPLKIPEKSRVELRAYALVESSRIGTEFQMIVVPKP